MKALRWYGIHDVRTEDIPRPVPGPGEVLIRVLYAGICGSDLHIYNRGMFIQNVPETMGHEFCGIVETVPEGVEGVSAGDRVIANPMVPCGTCESCRRGNYNTCEALGFIGEVRQGCFTEYIALPADRVVKVPSSADMRSMALTEPLAVAVNVCERAKLTPETDLLIIGAGPIGLLTAAAAKQVWGVREVTVLNRSEPRRKIAEALGAKAYAALPEGRRFDTVVEAAGSGATLGLAMHAVRTGGKVLPVSVFEEEVTLDINPLVGGQIAFIGCNCYTAEHLKTAAELIASGKIDVTPVITHEMDLSEGKEAFELLSAKEKSAAKILFRIG